MLSLCQQTSKVESLHIPCDSLILSFHLCMRQRLNWNYFLSLHLCIMLHTLTEPWQKHETYNPLPK